MANGRIKGQEIRHSGYIPAEAFHGTGLKRLRAKVTRMIRDSGVEFDAIAFRGVSGSLLGPLVATAMGKGLIYIRKKVDSHRSYDVEGCVTQRYIIIDDLIDSGKTIHSIREAIEKRARDCGDPPATCVGVFLYNHDKSLSKRGYSGGDYIVPDEIPLFPDDLPMTGKNVNPHAVGPNHPS